MFGKKETKEIALNYRGVESINGTNFLVTQLTSEKTGFKGSIHRTIHNLLFINSDNLSTSWLFPNNNQTINTFHQIPINPTLEIEENYYHEVHQPFQCDDNDFSRDKLTGWLLFVFSEDHKEKKTVALSEPSGNDFVQIIDEVEIIYNKIRINDDELILLYHSNKLDLVSKIKLSEKKVIETKELPKIQ